MDKAKARKKLAQAEQKIEEAEARVMDQQLLVGRLAADSRPTAAAEELLETLKRSARILRDIQEEFKRLSRNVGRRWR